MKDFELAKERRKKEKDTYRNLFKRLKPATKKRSSSSSTSDDNTYKAKTKPADAGKKYSGKNHAIASNREVNFKFDF
jgi:hypothetical protein